MIKKLAVIVLSLSVLSAHAGFLKKVAVAGAASYAGHAIAKKIEAKQDAKGQANTNGSGKVQPVNKEIAK